MKKKIDVPPFTKEEVAILKREERFEVLEERILRLQDLVYKLKEDFLVHIKESKEVGVDDSEEVFTKEELDGLFALTIGHLNAFSNPDVSDTLFWRTIINKLKLNKMLKEKE